MTPFVSLDAVAVPIAVPNVDTDQIFPARFLSKDRGAGLGDCLFRDLRFAPDGTEKPGFILNQGPFRDAQIVVGDRNFGCGSSRENAVWALYDYGIRAMIAPSFGDILSANSLKNGMLPVRLPGEVVTGLLAMLQEQPGAQITVDLPSQTVTLPDGSQHWFDIDPFAKHCLLNGVDELAFTLAQADQIAAFENRYGRENSY